MLALRTLAILAGVLLCILIPIILVRSAIMLDLDDRLPNEMSYILNASIETPLFALPPEMRIINDISTYDGNWFGEREEEFVFAAPATYVRALTGHPLWGRQWERKTIAPSRQYCAFADARDRLGDIYARSDILVIERQCTTTRASTSWLIPAMTQCGTANTTNDLKTLFAHVPCHRGSE